MEIEILKFGGSAMKTRGTRDKIAEIIAQSSAKKHLIVVSAMGKAGFPYATDTLKELIDEEKISAKEKDRLLAVGETIASVVLSSELTAKGLTCYSLSLQELGFKADLNYGHAYVQEMNSEKIIDLLDAYDVLICPGFIALNAEGEPTTFARGGSDLTAVLLGELLNIKQVSLYKDVDGIYPSKPPLDQRIKPYNKISFDEQLALAACGLEIVQKEAIEEAKKADIEIIIKSFFTLRIGSIIAKEESHHKLLGVNSRHGELLLATFYPCEVKEQLTKLFQTNHIYIKEEKIDENMLTLKLTTSQIFLARRLILGHYFLA